MEEPLTILRRQVVDAKAEIVPILLRARDRIENEIWKASSKERGIQKEAERERLFRSIAAIYDLMDADIDDWAKGITKKQAKEWHKIAKAHTGKKATPTNFSKQHIKDYFSFVHPDNAERLAAVRTKAMRAADIRILREAAIEEIRSASLQGTTGVKLQHAIKLGVERRFKDISDGGLPSWQFIDRGGKRWKSGNYFNMLTRTVTREVSNQAYIDSLLEDKEDLASITGGGDPCPFCARWRGVVVSLSGNDKRFPSYGDAVAAGVFHPNCVCQIVHVDEELDKKTVDEQAGIGNPRKPTKEEWNSYADRIQDAQKDKEGIFGRRQALKVDRSLNKELKEANVERDESDIKKVQEKI